MLQWTLVRFLCLGAPETRKILLLATHQSHQQKLTAHQAHLSTVLHLPQGFEAIWLQPNESGYARCSS